MLAYCADMKYEIFLFSAYLS